MQGKKPWWSGSITAWLATASGLHTFLPALNLLPAFSGVQVMYFRNSIKNCAPTRTVLLKTFVITVILMKPHHLCCCLPLIAFLCILFLAYHIVTVKNVLSKTQAPCSECCSAISRNSVSNELLGICLHEQLLCSCLTVKSLYVSLECLFFIKNIQSTKGRCRKR